MVALQSHQPWGFHFHQVSKTVSALCQEQVQRFSAGLGLTFPILLDSDGQVTIRDYQVVGMPGSIIVDRQGTIFYRHLGPMSDELLRQKLAELN